MIETLNGKPIVTETPKGKRLLKRDKRPVQPAEISGKDVVGYPIKGCRAPELPRGARPRNKGVEGALFDMIGLSISHREALFRRIIRLEYWCGLRDADDWIEAGADPSVVQDETGVYQALNYFRNSNMPDQCQIVAEYIEDLEMYAGISD